MSTLSAWTIGAMASKNARLSSPVRSSTQPASAAEVSGPVATITLDQSAGGAVISPRSIVISGCASSRAVTAAEKTSRSTASAPPAGTAAPTAASIITEPSARISQCKRPTAFVSSSSDRKEFEHTSSASPSVWWASVPRSGRISCSTTGTPRRAAAQAASLPAMPPPMTWIGAMSVIGSP